MGNEKLIGYLRDVKFSFNSYTMNATAIAAGVASVADEEYFREITDKVVTTREWVKEELRRLGFVVTDSKTNFVFATHKSVPAKQIFEALRAWEIYVRYWEKPRIDNHMRISIGTDAEMTETISFLESWLREMEREKG